MQRRHALTGIACLAGGIAPRVHASGVAPAGPNRSPRPSPTTSPMPAGYIVMGRIHHVPPLILYGVALQESARLFGDRVLPYPWTLNVAGEPRRFAGYESAVAALRTSVEQGQPNVDCGLLQVNWRYHHDKLSSFWAALDPYPNIGVGARLLRGHFDTTQDWFRAVGRYHSEAGGARANAYAQSVYRRIARIPRSAQIPIVGPDRERGRHA